MNEFSIGTFFPNKYLLELQDDWSLSNICQKVYDQFGRPLISASLRGTFRTQSNIRCEAFIKNRRTLGTDDLTIFKCFIVIFSLKKKTIQFSFSLSFQQKKSSEVADLALSNKTLCLSFWRHKQEKWLFQFSKLSWVAIYLLNSLAKSCMLFWKYS